VLFGCAFVCVAISSVMHFGSFGAGAKTTLGKAKEMQLHEYINDVMVGAVAIFYRPLFGIAL
jgi:hypothetical protein